MPIIEIELPDDLYSALEAWRRDNRQPRQDPENALRTIVEPVFASVEDYIRQVVVRNLESALAGRYEPPQVAEAKRQIAALEEQIKAATEQRIAVRVAARQVRME